MNEQIIGEATEVSHIITVGQEGSPDAFIVAHIDDTFEAEDVLKDMRRAFSEDNGFWCDLFKVANERKLVNQAYTQGGHPR